MRYDRFYGPGRVPPGAGPYAGGVGWGIFPGTPLEPFGAFGTVWPPYVPVGYGAYDRNFRPPRRPEESATYGRDGDEAARRWARRYGYDVEYTIRPGRDPRRGQRGRAGGRYDRGFTRYDRRYRPRW